MEWRLLEGLPEDDVRRVVAAARRRTFARGEVLFHEEDPADTLHLIRKGRIAVRVTTALGQTVTIAVVGRGDVLGEVALLGEPRRSATAIALEPSETLSVDRATFTQLRNEHPSVRDVLERILAERIRDLAGRVVEAVTVPTDGRVRRRLLDLAQVYGDGEAEVTVPLSQEEIAGLAGTTRATVNRVLREEKQRGTVRLGRGRVTVLDANALRKRTD